MTEILKEPYALKINCSSCGSEYEIHCTKDMGGVSGPKHCCYCDNKFYNDYTPPPDPYHPWGQSKD